MPKANLECNQNGGCDCKMDLQAATKCDFALDRNKSESSREYWNGYRCQDDDLKTASG
jgi:hypothetical protein